ncbi:Cysteine protease ATG4C [Schistosoma japonicum]|nr:Cysteine protease ATG4C [Schistosoma japonicum]
MVDSQGFRTSGNLKTIPKNIILDGNFSDFAADFASRLWFTYRDNFPPILRNPSSSSTNSAPHSLYTRRPVSCDCESIQAEVDLLNFPSGKLAANRKSNHTISLSSHHIGSSPANILNSYVPLSVQTSDCGWGCMFRCGQMLLAQALVVHFLGRNWRLTKSQRKSDFNLQIIKWFNDSWSPFSPLSLHRLVHVSGRKPGEFCGPASVCAAILRVMAMGSALDSRLNQVQVYLARDRIIYRESWYCPIPKTMNAENLDPSCAIGFYCRTRGELSDLIDRLPILMSLSGYHQTESTESRPATCIVEVISLDETKS